MTFAGIARSIKYMQEIDVRLNSLVASLFLVPVCVFASTEAATTEGAPAKAAEVIKSTGTAIDTQSAIVPISRSHEARLNRKLERVTRKGLKPFDQPDEAQAHYANKRTGPIITRGPSVTTVRPLDSARYLPALQHMRNMPLYSSSQRLARTAPTAGTFSAAAAPGAALGTWSNLGPANQGGRTRSLLIDPANPAVMYAGGVAGGVWKSTDGGANWSTNTDLGLANLSVSTLAFKGSNTNTIYAGTGEGVGNFDAVRGAGIFVTNDAGANWAQLPSTNNVNFHYTMKVIVSPRKTTRMYAATRTGLWRSLDSGVSWATVPGVLPSNGCTDAAIQEKRAIGYVFVSCGRTGSQGTVYRLLDADTSTGTSILSLPAQGRSSIAVAPSNESVIYVMAAQRTGGVTGAGPGLGGLHGVYRSLANGNPGSFTTQRDGRVSPANVAQKINQQLLSNPVFALLSECGFGGSQQLNQGWYDNVIAVDPMDHNRVWAGGIDLWRSDNGGVDWGTASYWWFDKGVDPQYNHADQHGIVFHPQYNGTTNRVMFSTQDGGVSRTDDARAPVNTTLTQLCGSPVAGGTVWIDRSNGYVTTQFYHGTAYPDGSRYFGGLQDNGTLRGGTGSPNWSVLRGGDGGYVALDTKGDTDPNNDVLFVENTGNSMARSTNGGSTFSAVTVGSPGVTPGGFMFIAPFEMNKGNRNHIWAGGFDIWLSINQANSWSRMTGSQGTCGLGSISALAAHPLDANRVLVGMSDGCYHYNHTALTAVAGVWPGGATIGNGLISSVAWDPNNINVAYATVSNFTANTVLKSVDGGVTWAPIMGTGVTALPQVPAHSVVVNPANSSEVFVGTDLGVFTSVDGGVSWYRENTGFANVVVEALAINDAAPYKLFAFTHGRGAWVTNLNTNGSP